MTVLTGVPSEQNQNRQSCLPITTHEIRFVTGYSIQCYTQHALRPVIDSKINHIRHFIKNPFINKGMDFIELPNIFRDKSVNHPYQINLRIMKYQSFVINIINLLGALYLISINLFLILISKLVTLTPLAARTLNRFIRLRVMLLRAI